MRNVTKLPVDSYKWRNEKSNFDEKFIKSYNEKSDKRYMFEVDVENPKHRHDLQNNLPFLPERLKIKKCHKLVCNL